MHVPYWCQILNYNQGPKQGKQNRGANIANMEILASQTRAGKTKFATKNWAYVAGRES